MIAIEPQPSRVRGTRTAGLPIATSPLGRSPDVLWLLKDPALYTALAGDRGWPAKRYEAWLARAMQDSLLPA